MGTMDLNSRFYASTAGVLPTETPHKPSKESTWRAEVTNTFTKGLEADIRALVFWESDGLKVFFCLPHTTHTTHA